MAVRGRQDAPEAAVNEVQRAAQRDDKEAKEREMLTRVMASLTALLSFAVVCFAGLMRGNSFASVLKGSLIAMAVGGLVGLVVSLVVRTVVTESFQKEQARGQEASGASPTAVAQGQASPRAAGQDRAAEAAPVTAQAVGRAKK